jgi:hypothetical protein
MQLRSALGVLSAWKTLWPVTQGVGFASPWAENSQSFGLKTQTERRSSAMTLRLLILLFVVGFTGCGESQPTAPPAEPKAVALPPEVELDPAAAAEQYKTAQKKRHK